MKSLNEAIKDLEDIVEQNIDNYTIPSKIDNLIRVGNVLVRPSKKHGFVIIDIEKNASIATTYTKPAALAAALAYKKKSSLDKIIFYDRIIEKNENDCEYYNNILNNTNENTKKQIFKTRLEIAESKIDWASDYLNNYIMKDIG